MPGSSRMGGRQIKRRIGGLLKASDFETSLQEIVCLPPKQSVNSLFSFFYDKDTLVRHRAARAVGVVVSRLASENRERARVIMRRLMWMLNDESGGIGWGAPEAMGEIMVHDEGLAREYSHILVSYLDESGNYLEYEPLQRGLLWSINRVAKIYPQLIQDAAPHLVKYLESSDPEVRGLAAMAAGNLRVETARSKLEALLDDRSTVTIYVDDELISVGVGDLAERSLALLESSQNKCVNSTASELNQIVTGA